MLSATALKRTHSVHIDCTKKIKSLLKNYITINSLKIKKIFFRIDTINIEMEDLLLRLELLKIKIQEKMERLKINLKLNA